ncbi:uncharacterized protein TNCV_1575231 [Trichonephila clavipes]|nr:uncharacterized protein TNCV_1575231 [Trichonephila clavipes]
MNVRTEETAMPSTSGYNLRPRREAKVESRPTNEKTQQGGPVQARRSRERHYSSYNEEQVRSSSRNTRSRSSQQQNCQERKRGANSNRSISLEVQIPSDLACAYLKGHLFGRASDWYQIFGSQLVQNTATDFAQLKSALTKAFPRVRNRKDLEIQFYSLQQSRDQELTDFIYDLLKVHKKLGLSMSEEALVEFIFVRLEPQVQDYVKFRNPKTTAQLLEVLAKLEERYSCKKMQDRQRNWRNLEDLHRPSNGRNDYRGNYETGRQRNKGFEIRNGFNRDDRRFNDTGYQSENRSQSENFSRGNCRNRVSSKNFSRGDQRQGGQLNVLWIEKVVTTIVEGNVEIYLTEIGLEESQKHKLRDLFNIFKGLFSDKPGLTHVLYHEIDKRDKPLDNSRPYRYVRAQKAFDAVKSVITEAPVLKLPYFKTPFELFTDASSIGAGAVLNQQQRPVIPTQLACAYLKGHLTGWALDRFDVLGYRVVEEKATDYARLKQALKEQFPVVRNRSELETCFYASYQNHNQRPSDFVYELSTIHKQLELYMVEEKLLDYFISWLEPQLLDYVKV